jgi:uncharacterized iron-regulated protein
MKYRILFFAMFVIFAAMKSDKEAFELYDANGKDVKYDKMIKELLKADIVFFGELHNNPISHWFELEITKSLYDVKKSDLVLGAEMFESDNQLLIDEYLNGTIKTKNFEAEAKLWPNYSTDYKPLLEFAEENDLRFIATNIPRRYAALVNKKGFEGLDSLSSEAKKLIAPLPVNYDPEVNCYKSMIEMMGGMGGHVTANIPKAQAIKDATMAYFILQNWEKGKLFLHYDGSYHSDNNEGIVWWLKQANPNLNILTITTVEQDTIQPLSDDFKNTADYIIVVPSDMTKTY